MIIRENKKGQDKELEKKLNNFLNDKKCDSNTEECVIKDQDDLVERVNKTYVTKDGRQLISEYTV